MRFGPFPPLVSLGESERLRYELLNPSHADALYEPLTAPAVRAFIDGDKPRPSHDVFLFDFYWKAAGPRHHGAPGEQWHHAVVCLDGAPIGRLEATSYGTWGEVAYLFGEGWWGQGYAFEAMQWWLAYLDRTRPGVEWWATTHPQNARSARLLDRLGFVERDEPDSNAPLRSFDAGDRVFILPRER